jgi:cytochrome c peroxidase
MKKALWVVGVLVVLGLALAVSNLLVGAPKGTVLTAAQPRDAQAAKVAQVLEQSCASCHVAGAKRPYYASWPVAKTIIENDVKEGLRDFDLGRGFAAAAAGPVPEPVLARIERQVAAGEMPPVPYVALHWNAALDAEKKNAVLAWVKEERAAQAAPGTPEALRTALIRPIPDKIEVDPAKVALGEKLYHDTRLSGDGTISCASCHDLAKGGTDQQVVSDGIRGQMGGINAPTTYNAALNFAQFWDGRAATLEAQADGPPNNPIEMGSNWTPITEKLTQDAAFMKEFTAVFPEGVNKETATHAIAEYERTLLTPNSRFDKYLKGDSAALAADEKSGYEAFQQKGCATCHVGELLGGRSYEVMGRQADYFKARGGRLTNADNGRYNVTKDERDRHAFKVPTLRNVALTFPYLHDGSKKTLREAVDAMAVYEVGEPLAEQDAQNIVKFLETLTGEYQGKAL